MKPSQDYLQRQIKRTIILDAKDLKSSKTSKKKNPPHKKAKKQQQQNKPLEIGPVIEAILAYGKKTHSLGELQAAVILEDIASGLKEHAPDEQAIQELINTAEAHAKAIRSKFVSAYEE
jgi:hypothetical protein